MASSILQKRKAANLLKKIGGSSDFDFSVVDGILDEVEMLNGKIPKAPDLKPLHDRTEELSSKIGDHTLAINFVLKELDKLNKSIQDSGSEASSYKKNQEKIINQIKDELLQEIASLKRGYQNNRGGSMPRQWQINGTTIMTRYADVNFITSGWSAANNDTFKRTDITVSGGSGSGFQLPLTGIVNGVNQTFTWVTTPSAIVVDGATIQKTEQGGTTNWTGTTSTILSVAPNQSIFAVA
jgi:hypothetical protein